MHRYTEIIAKLRSIQSRSKGELLKQAADALEQLQKGQEEERYRHDRLQDFEVAESEQLRQMTIERNMLARKLKEVEEPCQKKEVRLIDANALESALEATPIAAAAIKGKMFRLIEKAPTIAPESLAEYLRSLGYEVFKCQK